MAGRPYDEDRDLAAVTRMWREVGWIDGTDEQAEGLAWFLRRGSSLVADVDGEAECLVHRTPGTVRHLATELPLCAITAVTTSHVGKRRGLATGTVVDALTAAVAEGAAVASLGFFEQGFYDRFGFGTAPYEHRLRFDPASLQVPVPHRTPVRIGPGELREYQAMLARRHRGHGGVVLDDPACFESEWRWLDSPFGLGFRGDDGRLTHAFIASMPDAHGPCTVVSYGYEEPAQLLELLGLLRALADQVNLVVLAWEPADVQLQDLLAAPVRSRRILKLAGGSDATHEAFAEQQDRILDLPACIAAVRVPVEVDLGLRLDDPMRTLGGWPGISGEHTVHLGPTSWVEPGLTDGLPVLEASVGAFTRLWMGARPATGLALTDRLDGPAELLERLDESLRLPTPQAAWPF